MARVHTDDGHDAPALAVGVVVGGGISAGQVALRLCAEGHRTHLVSRHALREHQFDSDPGWLGPRFMARFEAEPDEDRRRAMIVEARHRGSLPPDVRLGLDRALREDRIVGHQGEVFDTRVADDELRVRLDDGRVIHAHRVLLATGFESTRPGGALVDDLALTVGLPCARCGYPRVDAALRWHPRIHVTGPLAELELGPVARNIAGARRAGDRLVEVARSEAVGRLRRAS